MSMCPFVNYIYVMYIMLCESLISMLLLFKSTYIYIYIKAKVHGPENSLDAEM